MKRYENLVINLENETCTLNGMEISTTDFANIAYIYDRMCTANFIMYTYDKTEDEAWDIAREVRELMNEYPSMTEEDAIDEVMEV